MRQIGVLPRNLDPGLLGDHLLALGMKSRIVEGPSGWAVWIYDENHLDRARSELESFLAQPDDPRFRHAARAAENVRRDEARRDREYRKNFRYVSDQWSGLQIRRRPLTLALVLGAIAIFIRQQGWRDFWIENLLLMSPLRQTPDGGLIDDGLKNILAGEVWRLITPIFLHFGLLHIVFNSWAMLIEGTLIETCRGTWRLAVLVLVSAILSNLGQYAYMERANPYHVHVFGGLSGVLYALFGYLWMKGKYEPEQGMILHPNTVTTMLIWLVLCMTGAVGPIANAAHVVGLVVGIAFGLFRF